MRGKSKKIVIMILMITLFFAQSNGDVYCKAKNIKVSNPKVTNKKLHGIAFTLATTIRTAQKRNRKLNGVY